LNLISLLTHGKFSLKTSDNINWNKCNRINKKRDPVTNDIVTLDDLYKDEIDWVIELLTLYEDEDDLFQLITLKDVYNFFYKALEDRGHIGEEGDLLIKLQQRWDMMRGGKKSRTKRTKRRRTTGGKKSRKLRKRTTLKGGKRKRRRTRRRR
jgi:hypothetical protein